MFKFDKKKVLLLSGLCLFALSGHAFSESDKEDRRTSRCVFREES